MADTFDYEGDDDIVARYENRKSDDERGGLSEAEEATSDNDRDDEAGVARRVDPSTSRPHVVRNPMPKLNTERLKGPNGISKIEKYFEGFKFYGKGHEKTDLDRIMKRMEHWSHLLFPKFHFDDFLTRVEQLGAKKDLQVYLKKYRLDMITLDDDLIVRDNMDNDEEDQQESAPLDDFDMLIAEQIEKQKQAEARVLDAVPSTSNEVAFDELLRQCNAIAPSSQIQVSDQSISATQNELSDDTREKIERNKQLAIQRRLQRQKERDQESKKSRLVDSTNVDTPNENDEVTICDGTNVSQVDGTQMQIDENTDSPVDRPEVMLLEESATSQN